MSGFRQVRKWAGTVGLLVAATAATGAWIRSFTIFDAVLFNVCGRQHEIYSHDGYVHWWAWRAPFHHWGITSGVLPTDEMRLSELGEMRIEPDKYEFSLWLVSYLEIAFPLTILAALFLVWQMKARRRGPDGQGRAEHLADHSLAS